MADGGGAGEPLGDAYVEINGDISPLAKTLQVARAMIVGFSQAGALVAIGGLAAVAAGISAALSIGMKSILDWAKEERGVFRMAAAIKMAGANVETVMPRFERLADTIQRTTTYSDDQVRAILALALNLGVGADKAEEFSTAAIGLASRLGWSAERSMMMLVRASNGYTAAFRRFGIVLGDGKDKAAEFAAIMKFAKEGMSSAEAETLTLTGAQKQAKNSFANLTEEIGLSITQSTDLVSLLQTVRDVLDSMRASVARFREQGGFATIFGGLKLAWIELKRTGEMMYTVFTTTFSYLSGIWGAGMNLFYSVFIDPIVEGIRFIGGQLRTMWEDGFSFDVSNALADWKDFNSKIFDSQLEAARTFVNAITEGPGTLAALDKVEAKYNKMRKDAEKTIVAPQEITYSWMEKLSPGTGKKKPGIAEEAQRMSVQVLGVADFWKKAQENAIEKKKIDLAEDANEKLEHIGALNQQMVTLMTNPGGLFHMGY